MSLTTESLYDLLGVGPSVSEQGLREAWRAQAKRLHPDAGGDAWRFAEVKAAYETLSDPVARRHYDEVLVEIRERNERLAAEALSSNGRFRNGSAAAGSSQNGSVSTTNEAGVTTTFSTLHVWIDQDLCTGDGLCADACPEVFTILEDGIAYVREGDQIMNDPGGASSLAWVPERLHKAVVDAAVVCPGECIFIEVE